jgi:hypothetical protein
MLPDGEVMGLVALMLLHESRRAARTSPDGDIILLDDQDRSAWNSSMIAEGRAWLERALGTCSFGAYTLQAAIAAVHASAATPADTDWREIVALYDLLVRAESTPIVRLNRAAASTGSPMHAKHTPEHWRLRGRHRSGDSSSGDSSSADWRRSADHEEFTLLQHLLKQRDLPRVIGGVQ